MAKDISGMKFGRLTATSPNGGRTIHGRLWNCVCECGNEAVVVLARLTSLHTRSCGCLSRELSKQTKYTTHGHTTNANRASASEYNIWSTMKRRCLSPSCVTYPRYGGRGITVDSAWSGVDGFQNFYRDMGPRPSKGHSLDRKNSDGPYSKDNCKWSTQVEQQNNRSGTRKIEWNGEVLTSAEVSRRTGILAATIRGRIDAGWPIDRVISTPTGNTGKRR